MKPLRQLPAKTVPADEHGYELFRELVWHNGEVCNSCFTQVRTIGPEMAKQLNTSKHRPLEHGMPLTMYINEWYDRTENGSQEHTTWDHNKRFGTCYCLNCGTDCNGSHRNKSLSDLKPLVANIFRYVKKHTEYDLDGKAFGREVKNLKKEPGMQGHETEAMALAFARALETDQRAESAPTARA